MSDNSNAKSAIAEPQSESDDSLLTSVNKDSVANYLLENPSFLLENPELLIEIQVQLQEKGAVSLTQIKASQAREKIKQLKSTLEDLVTNARQNEIIYKTYADLNLEIARANSMSDIDASLKQYLVDGLGLESAHVVLLDNNGQSAHQLSEIQQRSIFDKKLARQPFYFGRIGKIEKEALFPNSEAASVALVLLSHTENTTKKATKPKPAGLIAIASNEPLHFQPDMDTVLVDYLRKNLNFHINRLLSS
jgi:uncharacterized protein YigA (DUF484 family)